MFDVTKSPIQRDEKQLSDFVAAIEDTFHGDIAVD